MQLKAGTKPECPWQCRQAGARPHHALPGAGIAADSLSPHCTLGSHTGTEPFPNSSRRGQPLSVTSLTAASELSPIAAQHKAPCLHEPLSLCKLSIPVSAGEGKQFNRVAAARQHPAAGAHSTWECILSQYSQLSFLSPPAHTASSSKCLRWLPPRALHTCLGWAFCLSRLMLFRAQAQS